MVYFRSIPFVIYKFTQNDNFVTDLNEVFGSKFLPVDIISTEDFQLPCSRAVIRNMISSISKLCADFLDIGDYSFDIKFFGSDISSKSLYLSLSCSDIKR